MFTSRAIALLAALLATGTLHAHGDAAPKHGGMVRTVQDLTFELVQQGKALDLYVEDHGAPVSTAELAGRLTVENASGQIEAQLRPAGANKLRVEGIQLAPGDKVVARLTSADGQPRMTVRFTVK